MAKQFFSLKDAAEVYGLENIKILIGCQPIRKCLLFKYTSSSDEYVKIMCKLKEERFKLEENYKITIEPFHPNFADQNMYIGDIETMINEGHARIYVDISPKLMD